MKKKTDNKNVQVAMANTAQSTLTKHARAILKEPEKSIYTLLLQLIDTCPKSFRKKCEWMNW